jgi:plasmid maintenance system antidote protein VapI
MATNYKTNEQVIERVRDFFKERGLRNIDIANAIGATRADVSRLLNNGKIGHAIAKKLHATYGMSMGFLLSGCGDFLISQTDENRLTPITGEEDDEQLDNIAKEAISTAHADAQAILIDQLQAQVLSVTEENNALKNSLAYAVNQLALAHEEVQGFRRKIKQLLKVWSEHTEMSESEVEAIFNASDTK